MLRFHVVKSQVIAQGGNKLVNTGIHTKNDKHMFSAWISPDQNSITIDKTLKNAENGNVKTMVKGGVVSGKYWNEEAEDNAILF